jgi:hypothetical protein
MIMKKMIFTLLLGWGLCMVVNGQDINSSLRYYPGKVKYQKTEQDATVFEVPYSREQVEEGMRKMMNERGVKLRERNGFYEAKSISIVKLHNKVYDAYYKIEKDGKTACKIYLILTEPGEDVVSRSSSHAVIAAAGGGAAVAVAMGSSLSDHDHDVQVRAQEDDIKNAEKKFTRLVEDQKNLQKKLTEIQADIEKNTQDQARLQQEIEAKKATLETFKANKLEKGGRKN